MNNLVGQRIKERRKELKITQTQIQQETSISSGNLSCIENGKYLPSATALLELSKILNCSIDWILKGESPISGSSNLLDIEEIGLLNNFRKLSKGDKEEIMIMVQVKLQKIQKEKVASAKSSGLTSIEKSDLIG